MTPEPDDVTSILKEWAAGQDRALEKLVPLVYQELRSLAASHLRGERPAHTLQPTALVNEVFLRLGSYCDVLVTRRAPRVERRPANTSRAVVPAAGTCAGSCGTPVVTARSSALCPLRTVFWLLACGAVVVWTVKK